MEAQRAKNNQLWRTGGRIFQPDIKNYYGAILIRPQGEQLNGAFDEKFDKMALKFVDKQKSKIAKTFLMKMNKSAPSPSKHNKLHNIGLRMTKQASRTEWKSQNISTIYTQKKPHLWHQADLREGASYSTAGPA